MQACPVPIPKPVVTQGIDICHSIQDNVRMCAPFNMPDKRASRTVHPMPCTMALDGRNSYGWRRRPTIDLGEISRGVLAASRRILAAVFPLGSR